MCDKQKCNFNVPKYAIMVCISVDCYASFPWFWLLFCYPIPGGQNDADPTVSGSTLLPRISKYIYIIFSRNLVLFQQNFVKFCFFEILYILFVEFGIFISKFTSDFEIFGHLFLWFAVNKVGPGILRGEGGVSIYLFMNCLIYVIKNGDF